MSGLGSWVENDKTFFKVWAPFAKNVYVNGQVGDIELQKDGDYWSGQIDGDHTGQTYFYVVETADGNYLNRNDPYAKRLTASENGLSVVATDNFDWEEDNFTPAPANQQVIYEIHVGTFNRQDLSAPSTFDDVVAKLDYLQDMGITAIELMPIHAMVMSEGWGYAPTHLFAIENSYGDRHDLMRLVKEAHAHNISVLLDVVYNHLQNSSMWQFDGWSENNKGGIYFYNDHRAKTPWGENRPDYGRNEVRQLILDNVAMWLTEFHIDGLRLDSTIFMRQLENGEKLDDGEKILKEITSLAHKINPRAMIIAEDNGGEDFVTNYLGFDAQWGVNFPWAVRSGLGVNGQWSLDNLIGELQHYYNGNAYQKVTFSDSHDSAANGHRRLNEESARNGSDVLARRRSLIANTIILTAPGIPMILQGEEFLQRGYFNDWQALDWTLTEQFNGILQAHKDLIELRKTCADLQSNDFTLAHVDYENAILSYKRGNDTLVMINFGDKKFDDYKISLPNGEWKLVFDSQSHDYNTDFSSSALTVIKCETDSALVTLGAYQALVYRK